MSNVAYSLTERSISLYYNKDTHTLSTSHPNAKKVRSLIIAKKYDEAVKLIDMSKTINDWGQSGGVSVVDGNVMYKGVRMEGPLVHRILSMMREGFDVTPMTRFMENLFQNPSYTAIKELYLFLEHGNLPITEDGHFLAYKKVDPNYKDYYTRTIDNSIGAVCEVERKSVDDNRDRTCSYGLHFCALEYLSHYYGNSGHVMIVKINPKDVVSIPSDYNNTKGRTCRYEVVAEHDCTDAEKKEYFNHSVYNDSMDDFDYSVENVDYCPELDEYDPWWEEDEENDVDWSHPYNP